MHVNPWMASSLLHMCKAKTLKYKYMWTIFEAQYPLTIEVAFINVGTCTDYDGLFIVAKTGIEGTYRWGYSMYKSKNFGNRKSLSSTNPLPLIRN